MIYHTVKYYRPVSFFHCSKASSLVYSDKQSFISLFCFLQATTTNKLFAFAQSANAFNFGLHNSSALSLLISRNNCSLLASVPFLFKLNLLLYIYL